MRADLHVHSTASDGTLSPTALVDLALAQGVDVLAITDHDSVEGVREALTVADGTALVVIPAVELSASDGDRDVHILAYFVDHTDTDLLAHLAHLRASRLERARGIVDALQRAGYDLSLDSVLTLSNGGAVGRSHVAAALVAAGHAESIGGAFQTLIGRDRPFYVRKESPSPREVIETITKAGGLAVIAHPGITRADALLPSLVEFGLRGIEAYHSDHTPEQREHYAALARRLGLLVTGGSDFHGPNAPNPELGSVDMPSAAVEALLAAGAAL